MGRSYYICIMKRNVPSNFVSEIYNDYFIENLTTGKIAKKYDLKQVSIQKHIKSKYGLKSISQGMNKNRLNLTIFDDIDCEWKAYFLGWIITDGNVYTGARKNTISLCIKETDKYILEYFNEKIFKGIKKLNYRKARLKKGTEYMCKPLWRFQIDSKEIVNRFKELGIMENKSKIIKFLNLGNDELMRHFIRGIFEGDGCVTTNNKYSKTIQFISGSKKFLEDLGLYLSNKLHINSSIYNSKPTVYVLRFGKKEEVEKFKNFIYNDCEMKLERKYEKFSL